MTNLTIDIENIQYHNSLIIGKNNIIFDSPGLYAFFGKNGSGKTTLLKSISGLKSIKGKILYNNKLLESSKIAWIPSEPIMYEYLKVDEFYSFFLSLNTDRKQQDFIFDINKNELIKNCSTGNRKKVYLNTILQFYDYDIYIFDEPFNGLDLESTYILCNYIKYLSTFKIVLISSHIVEIIESFVSKSFYIENGLLNEISVEDLKKWILKL